MNRTFLLALVGDTVGTGAVQMKPVEDISIQSDIRRDSEGEHRGYLKWMLASALTNGGNNA